MRFLKIYLQIIGIIAGVAVAGGVGLLLESINDVWAIVYLLLVWAFVLALAIYKMEANKEEE